MTGKKFGMISLGCDKNRVDGERLLGEIKAHGGQIVSDPAEAQILIINTCAFLNSAREESINEIISAHALKAGNLEKIVVSGCLSEKFIGELFPALTEADVFLGTSDVPALFSALERAYQGERVNAVGSCRDESLSPRVVSTAEHYKYLKIADGCFNHCTYCLIPKIRGKYRSYPMDGLIREAASLGKTEELILVAQDVSRYGEDTGENKLVELLKKISELDNICHIRMLYCYPEMITDALIEEIATNDKILKYLDIPLQHSEDRILKLMGRRGGRKAYLALFEKLRKRIPSIALRTTFITGFPSETEEEHEALKSFLREAKFENAGVFAYSREEGTPAYSMKGQIHGGTKKRRQRELYETQAEISRSILQKFVGKTVNVICDGVAPDGAGFVGRAYFQAPDIDGNVFFTARHAEEGKIVPVRVERADTYDLFGSVEEEV